MLELQDRTIQHAVRRLPVTSYLAGYGSHGVCSQTMYCSEIPCLMRYELSTFQGCTMYVCRQGYILCTFLRLALGNATGRLPDCVCARRATSTVLVCTYKISHTNTIPPESALLRRKPKKNWPKELLRSFRIDNKQDKAHYQPSLAWFLCVSSRPNPET